MQTITININGADTTITLTPEQVAQVQQAGKPKLFEYEDTNCYVVWGHSIEHIDNECGTAKPSINQKIHNYGRYRRTKEAAEIDFKRQTRMMRLAALAWEVGECTENNNYYVCYDDKWSYGFATALYPETVLMSKETAIQVCKMLNSGEYSLDVE